MVEFRTTVDEAEEIEQAIFVDDDRDDIERKFRSSFLHCLYRRLDYIECKCRSR